MVSFHSSLHLSIRYLFLQWDYQKDVLNILKIRQAEGENHPYLEISTSFVSSFSSLLCFSHLLIQKILLFSCRKSTAILFLPFLKGFWFCYSVWNKQKCYGSVPCSLVTIFQQMVRSIVLNLCRTSSYAYILAGFFSRGAGSYRKAALDVFFSHYAYIHNTHVKLKKQDSHF